MRTRLGFLAMALTLTLAQAASLVPARTAMAAEQASEVVEGVVTKIDLERSRVTIRGDDGTVYEFEASAETLADLKLGDHIEAKRRPAEE